MAPAWLELDEKGMRPWAQLPLSVLPNILGFSMGGMAIVLAFAGSSIFRIITESGAENSFFIKIVASFFHFILVQTVAIILGLICRIYPNVVLSFFGYTAMCYAIMVALATAAQLFNTARVANEAAPLSEADLTAASTPSTAARPDAPARRRPS